MDKARDAFRTISEVATELGVPKHVLRFWESKFPQIKPMKRGGGRRYYRPEDMQLLSGIRQLLHADGYTIKGVQKILRERGVETVKHTGDGSAEVSAASRYVTRPSKAAGKRTRSKAKPNELEKSVQATARLDQTVVTNEGRLAQIDALIQELEGCRALLVGKRQPGSRKKTTGRKSRPVRSA